MSRLPGQRTRLDRARDLGLAERRGRQAVADVAEYLCLTTKATSLLYPRAVVAWSGYLGTAQSGDDMVADLRVLEAVVLADMEHVDLSRLDWRP